MDAIKTFSIKKQTSLLKRFPSICNQPNRRRQQAGWIVYGYHLSPRHFDDIETFLDQECEVIDCWKVGDYEVAYVAGELTKQHTQVLDALELDYANVQDLPDLSQPGLIVMDMDSTAIQIECIDEIAKLAGVGEQVSEITERAMQGELDFSDSLRQRVGTLKGSDESILAQVRQDLPFMPELENLVITLQKLGWKTAIASGGFTYFSDYLKDELNLDYAQSNTLEIVKGKLTGNVIGDIVSAETKADILVRLAEEHDIDLHNTVAVGDGANDLVMMGAAGLGVAYHAKPKVQQQASVAVKYGNLGSVLCILSASLLHQQKISWKAKP